MNALVSVIVPVYKVENYLNRCVESIIAQEYHNLEILLVDDGSPDHCPSLCDQWAEKDGRIKVIHKQNGGLSDARNAGMMAASGEYFCFVDSDDFIQPSMISNLSKAIERNNVKMSIANFMTVRENGKRVYAKSASPIADGIFYAEELLPRLYQGLGWYYIVAWNKLYHRSLFDDIQFPIGKIHEDEYVIAQLMWAAQKIACISTEEYVYTYLRKGSITAEQQGIRFGNWLEALYLRYNFYKENGLMDCMTETRAVYFRELEKLFCDPQVGDISREVRTQAKQQYAAMKEKTRNEKIYWTLFQINPKLEYKLIHKLREIISRE